MLLPIRMTFILLVWNIDGLYDERRRDHEICSRSEDASKGATTPSLNNRIAAGLENFLANRKQGTDVELT